MIINLVPYKRRPVVKIKRDEYVTTWTTIYDVDNTEHNVRPVTFPAINIAPAMIWTTDDMDLNDS